MVLASITKKPSYFSRYQVKLRRRREGRTDYQQRRALIKQDLRKYQAKKNRFIVRFTNNRVICQVAYSNVNGDVIIASASSDELSNYGLPVGLTNYAAAYATGLLCARRCLQRVGLADKITGKEVADGEEYHVEDEDLEQRPFKAVLDVGLARTTTGCRVFGAMKGAVDGGLSIPHSTKRFPGSSGNKDEYDSDAHRKLIFANHVADYMRLMQSEDPDKYQRHFSRYIKAGINADNLEQTITDLHKAIRANPSPTQQKKKQEYTHQREGNFIVTKSPSGKVTKYFRPKKLNAAQRAERVQKKIAEVARIAAEQMGQ